jgi:hypothetical protein
MSTRDHIKAAITELASDNFNADSVRDLLIELSGGIGFVLGAMRAASDNEISKELIDNSIDEMTVFIKQTADNVANYQPPRPN